MTLSSLTTKSSFSHLRSSLFGEWLPLPAGELVNLTLSPFGRDKIAATAAGVRSDSFLFGERSTILLSSLLSLTSALIDLGIRGPSSKRLRNLGAPFHCHDDSMTYATITSTCEVCPSRIVAVERVVFFDEPRLLGEGFFTRFTLEDNFPSKAVHQCNVAMKLVTMFLTNTALVTLPDIKRVWV